MAYDLLNEIRRSIALERLQGLADAGLSVYSSGLAELGGGLAYLPAAAIGGDEAGQYVKQATQNALTYQPRTEAGQGYMQALGKLMQPVADVSSTAGESFANALYKDTGSPLVGALATAAPTALAEMAGRFGSLPKAPDRMDITAYHGSPHDFDEFSMSKIGTGEGAQVYGHGLYFAESPDVAKQYARQLSGMSEKGRGAAAKDGSRIKPESAIQADAIAALSSASEGRALPKNMASIYKKAIAEQERIVRTTNDPRTAARSESLIGELRAMQGGGVRLYDKGSTLYTVDIPDEAIAKFLDWDKPLRRQPAEVVSAIKGMAEISQADDGLYEARLGNFVAVGESADEALSSLVENSPLDGGILVGAMRYKDGKDMGPAFASERLKAAGIPGIRYLDAGSRDGGSGTSNFVVFDDKLVKVLKKE